MGMKNGITSLKNILTISYKCKYILPYDPTIPLLGIYPRKWKHVLMQICTAAFIATLFITIQNGGKKLSINWSTGEWVNKSWYIPYNEYDSAVKRNQLPIHIMMWTNLENILLSERSQTKATVPYDSIYMTFWKKQKYRDRIQSSDCQRLEMGGKDWL